MGPIGGATQRRAKNNRENAAKPAANIGSATPATLSATRCHGRVQSLGDVPRSHSAHTSSGTSPTPNAATQ